MRIENGRMIYEPRACYSCEGVGHRDYTVWCPLMHQPVSKHPGRVCPHCGTKNRYSHKTVGTEHKVCWSCDGVGHPMETAYDSMPKELWASLTFKVYRSNRPQTWNEAHLGLGTLGSVTDYGRHKDLTDEQLIEKVKGDYHGAHPISGVVSREDTGRVCDHVAILTSDQGYCLVGVFSKL